MKKQLSKKGKRIAWWSGIGAVLLTIGIWGGSECRYRFGRGIDQEVTIKIYPGAGMDSVAGILVRQGAIRDSAALVRLAARKGIGSIQPGNYTFEKGVSKHRMFSRLQHGRQTPIRITFNNQRTIEKLAGVLGKRLMYDSTAFMQTFLNDSFIAADGFNRQTVLANFLPNTYELYWTIRPEEFYEMMRSEYGRFWNDTRRAQAQALGLSPIEVAILASIVIEETKSESEMADIAGVYMNRLRIGMPLQACPTVKFAVGDPTIRRITSVHLKVDSPYNTYRNRGLPPGMIAMPPLSTIDAVLNSKPHDYLYFCARADLSGKHAFARNIQEHNRNAQAYARELNRRGIK